MTLLIRGGEVVNADRQHRADVLVEGDTIVVVGPDLEAPTGATIIDAGGALVMPGGIDPHTHCEFRFMGSVSADDFEWGSKAALSGGTTTIVDMCVPDPGQSLVAAFDDWSARAKQAAADYSFHMSVTWWSDAVAREMGTIVERGVNSFKHFMAYKGSLMVDDDILFRSFSRCAELGAIALVHAENGDVVSQLQTRLFDAGKTGPEFHAASRPPVIEGEAANRAIVLADMAGCPLYIVHTSSRDAYEAIARARQEGKRVFGEPLIQHLTLDDGEYRHPDWDHAAQRVMSPPFRPKDHQAALWAGLQSGALQVVATDHCAFTTAQKRGGRHDFRLIPNGTGGLEDRLPVLWTAGVGSGRLTPSEFVAVTSANIARILAMPRKGVVAPGADADVVLWDPAATRTVSAAGQVSRIDYNVFEGFALQGLPAQVYRRGQLCAENGQVVAEAGSGRFVARQPHTAASDALRPRRRNETPAVPRP